MEYYTNDDYPIYAAEWIKEHLNVNEIKLFNEYNYGSYLVYQDIPVMIDSRADLYSPEFNSPTSKKEDGNDIFMDVQNVGTGATNYDEVFNAYGITHVITYSDSSLHSKLKKSSKYKKIYPDAFEAEKDNRFVIYEKVSNDIENKQDTEGQKDTEPKEVQNSIPSNKTIESNEID